MYRIAISLFMLWLLGVVYSYTLDGFIHVLPVIALVIASVQYVRTRPTA
ncbi:MAG TPA: lmo0937 family membrane protein [Burkholderiaceae bacterium]|nr:lmo0937 family membrane protein [Burkholderiaceae bacterium]